MFSISRTDKRIASQLQEKIDTKTKPLGALGQLEAVALKVGLIQQSLTPELKKPHMLVFAGDHGIVSEGVSPYPQEVTPQMVLNFLGGGAAINVFCRQHGIDLEVVNAGVAADLPEHPKLFDACVARSTASYLNAAAMTDDEVKLALQRGADQVTRVAAGGSNVIGFGEMGIGNTSSAALLMHHLTGIPLAECVGRGTGLDEKGVLKKLAILQQASANYIESNGGHPDHNPLRILARFGGFEIAMICGAMLKAAELKMLVLVDGFIATSALLVAHALFPEVLDYTVFTHQSDESGHRKMLSYLKVQPLLKLDLRLGEGSGVAVAYPLVVSSVAFLNEMASFADAGVSGEELVSGADDAGNESSDAS
ncbi:nicotinate-nucleotide--dimethylbenzimidazole phosphoribosyltransferase [Oceanospirillum sanctuarii]|uniref:nicotinate-nucleotide--dimethylbenzimidazole phosphoribosyltransferase n=1 Tax=Oceanospirillum sanctuarii TaxID=1434821 RepID=UPI000A396423|nr:nicotinate-nucleotide--dimethylbenzimidazole phosphoribosyltransferase [Oceanospirillum sanctuarii]